MKRRKQRSRIAEIHLSTADLWRITDHAQALGFCHGPGDQFWSEVDPEGTHVIRGYMLHHINKELWRWAEENGHSITFDYEYNNGVCVRAIVYCQMRGTDQPLELLCDLDQAEFESLPRTPVEQAYRKEPA